MWTSTKISGAEILDLSLSSSPAAIDYGGTPSLPYCVSCSRLLSSLKRIVDVVVALCLVIILVPVFALVAILVGRTGHVILFRHFRIGRNGKEFPCYKFRTMVLDGDKVLETLLARDPEARAQWAQDRKLRNDPRITSIGHFLRKSSLDELPQLINVIRGEMSLVGPRPVVREELERYGRAASKYLAVRPGITGLWQVTGRSEVDYQRRVALDCYYVRKLSPRLDTLILLKTVRVVFWRQGAY